MRDAELKVASLDIDLIDKVVPDKSYIVAKKILAKIISFRRITKSRVACDDFNCSKCTYVHLRKIIFSVMKNQPVTFVLPGFPAKSPNPEKVLGHIPDYAERLALKFLGSLCMEIKAFYTPGIKIKLCSDGRVFSDVIGMDDSHVTSYQVELSRIINELSLEDLSLFNLDDVYQGFDFHQMRIELMKHYGKSITFLRHKVRQGAKSDALVEDKQVNQLYRGITRFLFEDSSFSGQTKSNSVLQNEARAKAYEVIRRSNAWSELIAEKFPESVRLSIHPQVCGSNKLGIRLIENETWMTPWHGVAVEVNGHYVLMRRSEAQAMGAELIYDLCGRPSHFKLRSK